MGVIRRCSPGALVATCVAYRSARSNGLYGSRRRQPRAGRWSVRRSCISCHETERKSAVNPPHESLPTTCQDCHSEGHWVPAELSFGHPWPLEGAHARSLCANCHVGEPPVYQGTPRVCVGCHQSDYDNSPGARSRCVPHDLRGLSLDRAVGARALDPRPSMAPRGRTCTSLLPGLSCRKSAGLRGHADRVRRMPSGRLRQHRVPGTRCVPYYVPRLPHERQMGSGTVRSHLAARGRPRTSRLLQLSRRRPACLRRHANPLRRLPPKRLRQQPLPWTLGLPHDLHGLPCDHSGLDSRDRWQPSRECIPDRIGSALEVPRRLRVLPRLGSRIIDWRRERRLCRLPRRQPHASQDGCQAHRGARLSERRRTSELLRGLSPRRARLATERHRVQESLRLLDYFLGTEDVREGSCHQAAERTVSNTY